MELISSEDLLFDFLVDEAWGSVYNKDRGVCKCELGGRISMQAAYTIEQLKNQLVPVFRRNKVRKAILFGSYSKGSATPTSDVEYPCR